MVKKATKKMVKSVQEKKTLGKVFEIVIDLTQLEEDIALLIRLSKINSKLTSIGLTMLLI